MLNLTATHEFYPIEMLFGIWTWVPKEPCIRLEPKSHHKRETFKVILGHGQTYQQWLSSTIWRLKKYVLGCHLSVNRISSYSSNQCGWQPGTYIFNHYNVLFLMNLHSTSTSNTNSTQILHFILTCLSFTTGHFHTCVLCKECSLGVYYFHF